MVEGSGVCGLRVLGRVCGFCFLADTTGLA